MTLGTTSDREIADATRAADACCTSLSLKNATRDLHETAESHPFQLALASGRVTRDAYRDLLSQWWHIHGAIESRLIDIPMVNEPWRELVSPDRMKTAKLFNDLICLGRDPGDDIPLSGTSRLVQQIHQRERDISDEFKLLGGWYVLEGSTNGNKHVARVLARTLGLSSTNGLCYYDAYGSRQSEQWSAFKSALDRLPVTESSLQRVIAGATAMFSEVIQISTELWARHGAASRSAGDGVPQADQT